MKRICVVGLMGLICLFSVNNSFGQNDKLSITVIEPYTITVSYTKTTNLIFPYAITSVDRGSSSVIVQKAKGVENILQTKASRKDFEPTNLSIITADGKFYSILLVYAENSSPLNISFSGPGSAEFAGQTTNAHQLEKESWQVLAAKPTIRLRQNRQDLQLTLNGISHSENNVWFKLRIVNNANVSFKPAYVRFFIRDKSRAKRSSQQETEITPIYTPSYVSIKGKAASSLPIGFKSFTISKRQQLIIQIGDETGSRVIQLPVKSKFLLRAKNLMY